MNGQGRDFWRAAVALSQAAQPYHTPSAITAPYESGALDLTIFVSCYNEEAYITGTLDTIIDAMRSVGRSYEIVVIDDGSRDRSVELLRRYIGEHAEVPMVLRVNKQNKGLAQNYVDAAFIGCGTWFCLIRGDNRESMETLSDVLKTLGEADVLVASNMSRGDRPGFYARMFNLFTRQRIRDYGALTVHLRFNVMRWHPDLRGLGFHACLISRLLDLGFTFKLVPCRSAALDANARTVTWKKTFSMLHAVADILLRRLANRIVGN